MNVAIAILWGLVCGAEAAVLLYASVRRILSGNVTAAAFFVLHLAVIAACIGGCLAIKKELVLYAALGLVVALVGLSVFLVTKISRREKEQS